MKVRRNLISLVCLIAVAVPGAVFAAGQQGGEATQTGSLEISWIGINDKTPESAIVVQELNKALNIVIKPVQVMFNNNEQMNLLLASGDIPDHMLMYFAVYERFLEEGALKPIPINKVLSQMPAYTELLQKMHPTWKDLWYIDGDNFETLPHASKEWFPMNAIRTDWLEQVGKGIPTNLEEFEDVMRAFTKDDPDGNGKDDTFGFTMVQKRRYEMLYILNAFGLSTESVYVMGDGGKITRAAVTPAYRDALKYIAGLYTKGYIHPDVTMDNAVARDQLVNSKVGLVSDTWTWLMPAYRPSAWFALFLEANPGATYEFIPPLKGSGYIPGVQLGSARVWAYSAIGKDTSDAKMEKVMAVLEIQLADDYYQDLIWSGKEGVHFDRRPDGMRVLREEWTPSEKQDIDLGLKWPLMNMRVTEKLLAGSWGGEAAEFDKYQNANYGIQEPVLGYAFQSEVWKEVGADVGRVQGEFLWQAVTGKLDIDAEWDGYVQAWLKAGGQRVLDEANDYYVANVK